MHTAAATVTSRVVALIRHQTIDGAVGWGEYAPWPTPPPGAATAVEAACRSGHSDDPMLQTAIATAAADAEAREAGQRLSDVLAVHGVPPRRRVAINAVVGAESIVDDAVAATEEGFLTLKCKVGVRTSDADVAFVAAVREAVGPVPRIRLDANGAWDVSTAIDVLSRVAPFDIEFVEQPVFGLEHLAEVRRRSSVAIAADEDVRDVDDLAHCRNLAAADVVVCKPAWLGAPADAVAFTRAVVDAGMDVVIAGMFDSAVGLAAATAVASVAPTARAAGLGTADVFADDVASPLPRVDGALVVPDSTGVGCVPADEALDRLGIDPPGG